MIKKESDMTDRGLLELAAKAAGYEVDEDGDRLDQRDSGGGPMAWNPLEDDGDALRLAVALKIEIHFRPDIIIAWYEQFDENGFFLAERKVEEGIGETPSEATRRAIVRAAAEIGKTLL